MYPEGTKGFGGTGGSGSGPGPGPGGLLSSLDFLEKTIARIIPIRMRTPTAIPITIFLFFLLGYLS